MNKSIPKISTRTSVRRYFVDKFFFSNSHYIKEISRVADIGGKRVNKRGVFNVDTFNSNVDYINIDPETKPDILADASNIPISSDTYDVVLMGEVLEHLPNPKEALIEAYRVLKEGGVLIATVPFISGVHGDPDDYGRYTRSYLEKMSEETGFLIEKIEAQGTVFASLAFITQHLFLAYKKSFRPIQYSLINFLMWLDKKTSRKELTAWPTGYGILLRK